MIKQLQKQLAHFATPNFKFLKERVNAQNIRCSLEKEIKYLKIISNRLKKINSNLKAENSQLKAKLHKGEV